MHNSHMLDGLFIRLHSIYPFRSMRFFLVEIVFSTSTLFIWLCVIRTRKNYVQHQWRTFTPIVGWAWENHFYSISLPVNFFSSFSDWTENHTHTHTHINSYICYFVIVVVILSWCFNGTNIFLDTRHCTLSIINITTHFFIYLFCLLFHMIATEHLRFI